MTPANPFTPGLLSRLAEPPRKVALVRASRIGDFICATPAFRALRAALPDAEITMITLPMLRGLALRSPHLDRYAEFPGFPGLAEQLFEPRRAVSFFQQMQAERFDLAIQMQGSGVYSNPFTLLLGARATAGFVRPDDPSGRLSAALPLPQEGHEVERVLSLAAFLGAEARGHEVEFALWPEDHRAAGRLLAGARPPLIGLHPAARDMTQRWPPERFAAAAVQLRRQVGGTVVILAEAGERAVAGQVAHQVGRPVLNLAGKTSLTVLGGVIARLAVLLTNDTGPAHIAYALGTPSVVIFGKADPARYGPVPACRHRLLVHPVPCRPCGYSTCPVGYPCLRSITEDQVAAAAAELLQGSEQLNRPELMLDKNLGRTT